MVLASQSSRTPGRRRYMVSRRRRKWRTLIAGAAVIGLIWVTYSLFSDDGDQTSAEAANSDSSQSADEKTSAPDDDRVVLAGVLSSPPPRTLTPSPTRPIPIPEPAEPAAPAPGPTNTTTSDLLNPPRPVATLAAVTSTPGAPAGARAASDVLANALTASPDQAAEFRKANELIEAGQPVEARARLSKLLESEALNTAEARTIRDVLTRLNADLIFSKRITPNDPLVAAHKVKPGQFLGPIARQYKTPWQLLERVNHIKANRLRAGSTIKVVRGPFHAVVDKSEYRMDMYLDDPNTKQRIYIRSFEVGHGENNSTPTGAWLVERGRKLINPPWTNPRTGEFYNADDPKNPIGDRWIGLKGTDSDTQGLSGYGIHGTIEPDSIGKQKSMGCVRLRDDDVAWVYDLLYEGLSTVVIKR